MRYVLCMHDHENQFSRALSTATDLKHFGELREGFWGDLLRRVRCQPCRTAERHTVMPEACGQKCNGKSRAVPLVWHTRSQAIAP